MEATSRGFVANARAGLADAALQESLSLFQGGFTQKRAAAAERLPEFEALRDRARAIKDHTLARLDFYLERFEEKVVEAGGTVHWCQTPAEARSTVLALCREARARTVTKSKSMIAEEMELNPFLEAHGIEPVETDLGEYIIQLADERPSHIIAPAIHKTKDQVSDLFHEKHRTAERSEAIAELVEEARKTLRPRYLAADVGITGANFLIAETGSIALVTNEGNAELTRLLPRAHIVIATLEKVVPTLEDAATLLRVLARSATGQEFSTYTTFATGPRRPGDADGPEAFHVVLLDNGRSRLLESPTFRDVLRCIKCGACMNHCPVYGAVGGHAYGWVYPGPIGAVLTPNLIGLEEARHLPNASSFCGRCEEVCPMRIPLPGMMRALREAEFERRLGPPGQRWGVGAWAWLAGRPRLYRRVTGLAARLARIAAGGRGGFRRLPLAGGWTAARDMPAPEGATFHALWRKGRRP